MTTQEFYTEVLGMPNISTEAEDFAKKALKKITDAAETRRTKNAEKIADFSKRLAETEIYAEGVDFTARELADSPEFTGFSIQYIAANLATLAGAGMLVRIDNGRHKPFSYRVAD